MFDSQIDYQITVAEALMVAQRIPNPKIASSILACDATRNASPRKSARVVKRRCFESRWTARSREFDSHLFRHKQSKSFIRSGD